jgi:hypothetical protein
VRALSAICIGLFSASLALANGKASVCKNKELHDRFTEYTSPMFDSSPAGLRAAFSPYKPDLIICLKRWVEDGGMSDGLVPRDEHATRATVRLDALTLIGELYKKDESVAAWIRASMASWPELLQQQAVSVLARVGGWQSFAFLKEQAKKSDGAKRDNIWQAMVLLDPDTFAAEVESIAPSHDEQKLLGATLVAMNQRSAIPTLRRLQTLVPEKAASYAEYIRELDSSDSEDKSHEKK